MKKRKRKIKKISRRQTLTLMSVQEKLGLFRKRADEDKKQQDHDYLKKKPLGLI
jgi:hypothetical protein